MLFVKLWDYFSNAPPESIRTRFATGIGWNALSSVFTQGSVFLANIIIANILGREIFGEFGMIQNTVFFFAGLGQMATGVTATKYIAEFRSNDPARAGRILGLCSRVSLFAALIATVTIALSASWLSCAILKAPHLALGLTLSSGVIFFAILNGFQTGALAGLEGYSKLGHAAILQTVFYLGFCSIFTFLWKLEGALAGLAVSFGFRWYIFNQALARECSAQKISIDYRNWLKERSILTKFAIPSAVIGFFSVPAVWLANVFLVRQPGGYAQLGLFSAAFNLRTMIIFLPSLMNNVGMSLLNYQKGTENTGNYKKVFVINIILTQSVGLIGGGVVIIFGRWLLMAFGKEFTEGYSVLLILVVSAFAEISSSGIYQVILSKEKMWLSFLSINTPWWIVFLISAYFLIPTNLSDGLAWAYLTAWCVHAAMTGVQVWRVGLWKPERRS